MNENENDIAEEIDMILMLERRAHEAAIMGFPEIALGAKHDATRRRSSLSAKRDQIGKEGRK